MVVDASRDLADGFLGPWNTKPTINRAAMNNKTRNKILKQNNNVGSGHLTSGGDTPSGATLRRPASQCGDTLVAVATPCSSRCDVLPVRSVAAMLHAAGRRGDTPC